MTTVAVRRLPALLGAGLALAAGVWGGLALLGLGVPLPRQAFAAQHGPLMALGFLGTLIALERAVALGRTWGYAAPALGALGAVALLAGFTQPGRLLLTASGGWLIAVYVVLLARRGPGRDTMIETAGAVAWYAGGLLWTAGRPVADLVPWLAGFLVLTIAGERLELARVAFLKRRAGDGLILAAGVFGTGVVLSARYAETGWRVAGAGMLALAGWLALHDVARRTVRSAGLPRYVAACLLAGYVWLAAAGTIWAAAGRPVGGAYDAALHALFLGFVMSMVFGHAPVILPAVLRVRLPYRPAMYGPLALLHVSLVLRVVGDLGGPPVLRTTGGALGAVALAAFVATAVVTVIRKPSRPVRTPRAQAARSARPASPKEPS